MRLSLAPNNISIDQYQPHLSTTTHHISIISAVDLAGLALILLHRLLYSA